MGALQKKEKKRKRVMWVVGLTDNLIVWVVGLNSTNWLYWGFTALRHILGHFGQLT